MISWPFTFATATDDRVGAGELRFTTPPPYAGRAVHVRIANLNSDGLNVRRPILAHPPGTTIYVQDRADDLVGAALLVTGPPIEHKGFLELPALCTEASPGAFAAGPVEAFFMPATAVGVALLSAATDPPLVTLDTAKRHLRIDDDLHDDDVIQKLASASGAIRDYLKSQNDPLWTSDTAPPWVVAAVLLLLAHLYEHRGDEFGASADLDDRVWNAIGNLLRRSRDPALA